MNHNNYFFLYYYNYYLKIKIILKSLKNDTKVVEIVSLSAGLATSWFCLLVRKIDFCQEERQIYP